MHRRDFLSHAARGAGAFGIFRHLAAFPSDVEAPAPGDKFSAVRDRYFIGTLEFNPVISTYLGGDGYSRRLAGANGRLRDYRPDGLDAERQFYRGVRDQLTHVDRTALPSRERIDYDVLTAQLGFLLHQLDDLRYYERAVDTYVAEPFRGVDWQIQQMRALPGGLLGTEDEWDLVVSRLTAVPAYLRAAAANLERGRAGGNLPDRRMVERDGIGGSGDNATYFRGALLQTAERYLGSRAFAGPLRKRLAAAGAAAADAYVGFAAFLRRTYAGDTADRYAVGEAEYDWRLRHCLNVGRTAAELWEYGATQVARYEAELAQVAREVARGAGLDLPFATRGDQRLSVRRVMDHLAAESPRDDDELLRWYREAGTRAVAYGREHGLFDVPAAYRLDVVPTPPVLRSTIDAAYYPAPPFKQAGVGRFYLTPTGNDPAALRLNNRASVADTAVHEGFPGHDWHYKYMTQHAGEISNVRWLTPGGVEDSSSMWEDSMAAEGWALYGEELMAEPAPGRPHGFYTAAEHLYELQGQLLRAARVRVDVGLHTGRMSFDQAVDYFTEHTAFYPGACARAQADATARAVCENARRAIYRYSKWPTQAVTYNLGKGEIVALRDAARRAAGARFSAKDFHERLMRMGTIPVGYFRESFLKSG